MNSKNINLQAAFPPHCTKVWTVNLHITLIPACKTSEIFHTPVTAVAPQFYFPTAFESSRISKL